MVFAMSFSGIAGIFASFKLIFENSQFLVINAFAFQILCSTGLTVLEASFANVGIALVSAVSFPKF